MKCQKCGKVEATVHVLQINDSGSHSLRLCQDCASHLRGNFAGAGWNESAADFEADEDDPTGPFPEMELGAILGHFFSPQQLDGPSEESLACPTCGYRLSRLRKETRLGCATCYTTFRTQLRPVIQRFHRHLSHLGRTPAHKAGGLSQSAELTRVRVALEQAIASEDFEEAARLRDRISGLSADPGA